MGNAGPSRPAPVIDRPLTPAANDMPGEQPTPQHVWVPGHWDVRPRARAVWVKGRWRHHPRGWYWVEGHWR